MSSQQLGFIVGRGVSALVVAFLLAYSAHYDWGLPQETIRFGALGAALIIAALVAIDHNLSKRK